MEEPLEENDDSSSFDSTELNPKARINSVTFPEDIETCAIGDGSVGSDDLSPPKSRKSRTSRFICSENTIGNEDRITKIELLVEKAEKRKAERMPVAKKVRIDFLKLCQNIATDEHYESKLPVAKLKRLRDDSSIRDNRVRDVLEDDRVRDVLEDDRVRDVLEEAIKKCDEVNDKFFVFRDFNHHSLVTKQSIFNKNRSVTAFFGLLLYYVLSSVLFCVGMDENDTCPEQNIDGWLNAVYFASVTMSTVGYGDVTLVNEDSTGNWTIFLAVLFMLVSMIIAVTVYSSLASNAVDNPVVSLSGSNNILSRCFKPVADKFGNRSLLFRISLTGYLRLLELFILFVLLNLFGMCVAKIIVHYDRPENDWSWMKAFYWAVQTTTTIGYGDIIMPAQLRWFNVLFTTLGTTYFGALIGSIATLKDDLKDMRTFYSWKHREVSMRLFDDIDEDDDGKIDEYEFLVYSLIALGKLHKNEVKEIMDKFRELANDDLVISKEGISDYNRACHRRTKIHTNSIIGSTSFAWLPGRESLDWQTFIETYE